MWLSVILSMKAIIRYPKNELQWRNSHTNMKSWRQELPLVPKQVAVIRSLYKAEAYRERILALDSSYSS